MAAIGTMTCPARKGQSSFQTGIGMRANGATALQKGAEPKPRRTFGRCVGGLERFTRLGACINGGGGQTQRITRVSGTAELTLAQGQ